VRSRPGRSPSISSQVTVTSTDRRIGVQLAQAIAYLKQAGVDDCQTDARILLESCAGMSHTQLLLGMERELSDGDCTRFHSCLERRAQGEPVAYIVGEREFWSLSFIVSPAVLIPRPETEFLLDRVLALADHHNWRSGAILDLCCGSGVIGIVLAKESGLDVIATDFSPQALAVTDKNVRRHGLDSRIHLVEADLLSSFASGSFSLIVSNPPYVSSLDIEKNVARDVRDFEPHLALDGGKDGLDCIVRIHAELPRVMRSGGEIFMEIGADQGPSVGDLFRTPIKGVNCFSDVRILQDYAGRDRVLAARWNG